ncbi:hypothetical protein KY308_03850, partial [Candidatus Woesearchaeota archaeon]|nr:hypothetical protein [Candidatus Woesearchaeota archaeon]
MSGKKNRKKRKAESNNSKQKVLSRRNFAIGTAVAIPVFGFLGFKIFSSHQENLPSEQGLDYRLKVSRSPNTNILVGEQDIMSMKKEFDRIVNYVQDKKKVKVLEMDVTFLNGEISYEILDSEPSPDLIPLAKELVADALDFWKHPKLRTPVLSFQIPSTVREIKKFPPYYLDQNVTINLIKSWFSNYFFEFKAFTDNGDFEFRANIRSKPSGTAVRDYSFSGNNLAVRRNEVFWVVTKERKYCLDTPAMEVFHNQISEYTD